MLSVSLIVVVIRPLVIGNSIAASTAVSGGHRLSQRLLPISEEWLRVLVKDKWKRYPQHLTIAVRLFWAHTAGGFLFSLARLGLVYA